MGILRIARRRPSLGERVARAAWRRWRLVVGVFFMVTAGVWLGLALVPAGFESETSLLVLPGEQPGPPSASAPVRSLEPEARILRSRRVIEKVVDELGPDALLRSDPAPLLVTAERRVEPWLVTLGLSEALTDRDRAVIRMERSLTVVADERSHILTLRVRLHDAHLCARALETLIEKYLETQVDVRWNLELVHRLEHRAAALDASVAGLPTPGGRFESPSTAEIEGERRLLLQRLSETQAKRDSNEIERRMLSKEREEMTARLRLLPERVRADEVVRRNPARDRLEQRITELKLQRQDYLSRFQPTAPPVTKVEGEIAGLEALLGREDATRVESATTEVHPARREFTQRIEALDVRIAGLAAEGVALERQAERLGHELGQLGQVRAGLEELDRARDVVERSYAEVGRPRWIPDDPGELGPMRVAAVAVLSPPAVPLTSVHPRRLLVLATALPLAMVLAVGFAFTAETVHGSPEGEWSLLEVEGFDFPGSYVLPRREGPRAALEE
jgi:uncharacterized protein involved in exopolysaccharide biosynthesis